MAQIELWMLRPRVIETRAQDYEANRYNPNFRGFNGVSITEGEIAQFCKGCDFLKDDNSCGVVSSRDQARYAFREWCGKAQVGGKRAINTGGLEGSK